jgi:type IV pilus assembly protein PilP
MNPNQMAIADTMWARARAVKPTFTTILLIILLSGCGGDGGDDLDQFIRDSGNGLKGNVEPLPEVMPYSPVAYNPDGALHDPFKPRKAQVKTGGFQPNLNRPREPLEAFPLESLQLVGIITKGKLNIALIKTPENTVQQVKIGNYLGQNLGVVVDIVNDNPAEVKVKEIIQDELSGEWAERPASIVQQEQGQG